ncbi:hypothetical protein FACS1894190_14140 [Spirochaetia bacterium]|nr:hypothetical protein FACS1894190_14140 [Spirochaetia bacterium]
MKKVLSLSVMFLCAMVVFSQTNQNDAQASIAMLNYLGTQTVMIEQSKNNRLLLEQIHKNLYNNTNTRSVFDTQTLGYINSLRNQINGLRLIDIQREKLELIYETQKAQAISKSLPNPLYLLAIKDKKPLEIIMTATMMAVDSTVRYNSAKNDAFYNLYLGNLDLQKDEIEPISNLANEYYGHAVSIVGKAKLDGSAVLSQEQIATFVKYVVDSSNIRNIEWLERNRTTYAKYAPYWLVLANVYYELKQYEDCLKAVQMYETVQKPIFLKDFDFARVKCAEFFIQKNLKK